MDVAGLRRELEEHLKLNPHEQAPEGFRDRFEHWAEAYESEQDEEAKAELEALLRRVPAEAEAAAKAGVVGQESGDKPRRKTAPARPAPKAGAKPPRNVAPPDEPEPATVPARRPKTLYRIAVAALALGAAAAAYLYSGG